MTKGKSEEIDFFFFALQAVTLNLKPKTLNPEP